MNAFSEALRNAAAFEDVIAAWAIEPLCEVVHDECADGFGHDGTGQRCCTELASWRWRRHDCTSGIFCSLHREVWYAAVAAAHTKFPVACDNCGKVFHSLDDLCTVTPL